MEPETKNCRSVAVCLIVSMLLVVWFVPRCFAVDAVEANGAIGQAERDLGSAYVVVGEAESAGANVSVLLNRLGSAGDFLSEAYVALRAGEYGNASSLAAECSHSVAGIAGDAARLKADAERARSDRLLFTAGGSGVGLVLLFVFGFFGWRFLKRWYSRRVLDMKPEMEGTR
jgi:hypothetical protein